MLRSELCGLLGILIMLAQVLPPTNKPTCWVACDGKSALYHIQHNYLVDHKEPHANLISACQEWIRKCPYDLEWHHVKGHQDNHVTTALKQDTWLNIEVDQIAQQYLLINESFVGPTQYTIPRSQWGCFINGAQVVKQLE